MRRSHDSIGVLIVQSTYMSYPSLSYSVIWDLIYKIAKFARL